MKTLKKSTDLFSCILKNNKIKDYININQRRFQWFITDALLNKLKRDDLIVLYILIFHTNAMTDYFITINEILNSINNINSNDFKSTSENFKDNKVLKCLSNLNKQNLIQKNKNGLYRLKLMIYFKPSNTVPLIVDFDKNTYDKVNIKDELISTMGNEKFELEQISFLMQEKYPDLVSSKINLLLTNPSNTRMFKKDDFDQWGINQFFKSKIGDDLISYFLLESMIMFMIKYRKVTLSEGIDFNILIKNIRNQLKNDHFDLEDLIRICNLKSNKKRFNYTQKDISKYYLKTSADLDTLYSFYFSTCSGCETSLTKEYSSNPVENIEIFSSHLTGMVEREDHHELLNNLNIDKNIQNKTLMEIRLDIKNKIMNKYSNKKLINLQI